MTGLTEAQKVAEALLDQLEARRFLITTGACDLVATAQGLQFKLPANLAEDGVNMIRVELNVLDTYDVIAGRWSRQEFKEQARESMIYGEDLQRAFTRLTGLNTHI